MKDLVQKYFQMVYGPYLEEKGYFRRKKVYYKIEKEKELVYFVSIDKGRWGRFLDVDFDVWPFCPYINMNITACADPILANMYWKVADLPLGGWEYDRESESSVKHAIEESYQAFQKVAVPILDHIVDAQTHYKVNKELEEIINGKETLGDAGKIYECLNIHYYGKALKYVEYSIQHAKEAMRVNSQIMTEEQIQECGYQERIEKYKEIGEKIEAGDYAYLDAIVEIEKEKTRESIRAFFRHFEI